MYELNGAGIKQLRKDQNLTQEAFGQRIDAKRITVQKYESEKIQPSVPVVLRMCNEFNIYFEIGPDKSRPQN